ncbi:uncharacterized protein METZ01_LOCUS223206 [marine metagenome]|uniref:Thioredoxin domain-containing protein n=1 Tax=marine metagenome TaxID=408172 RepID=A0A382G671_9ZZZZ
MEASPVIVDVTVENFQSVVGEQSKTTPVLLEFYAEGAEQCASTSALLQKLAAEYAGKFILGRVEVQQNPQIVQQLGIKALPTIKIIFQGQMAGDIEGPAEEQQLRDALDQITMSPMERVREQVDLLVLQGERQQAIKMLREVIAEEPNNFGLHVELCDLLILEGETNDARQILEAIPQDTVGIEKPRSRLEFLDLAGDLGQLSELQARVSAEPENLRARFELAIRLVVEDRTEEGLDVLLDLMKADREWEDELARKTMIKIFNMLGKGNGIAVSYRRKMFSLLH